MVYIQHTFRVQNSKVDPDMEVAMAMGVPPKWWVYKGKSHENI